MGFQKIFMTPNSREKWDNENIQILKEQFEKIYIYMGNCFSNNIMPISMQNINESFEWILKHDLNILQNKDDSLNNRSCNRCGMGISFGSIGYDG